MEDQKFRYVTVDNEKHTLDISVLHLAKVEMQLDVSVMEFVGRIEPQLLAAHMAWTDKSADNRAHFLSWCDRVVEVDGHKTLCTVGDVVNQPVPYRIFVEAEKFFKKSFLHLSLNNPLNLRMFIVWKMSDFLPGDDFYDWLNSLPEDFECDVSVADQTIKEGQSDAGPKVLATSTTNAYG